jgi:hypothetical protein
MINSVCVFVCACCFTNFKENLNCSLIGVENQHQFYNWDSIIDLTACCLGCALV